MAFDSGQGRGQMVSQINVTPLVDVMLVLLVIFMVTAPIIQQGVEVTLPSVKAEALITTAVGLIAAIPAQMFYNYFIARVRVLATEMDNFTSEFLNIAERHFLS